MSRRGEGSPTATPTPTAAPTATPAPEPTPAPTPAALPPTGGGPVDGAGPTGWILVVVIGLSLATVATGTLAVIGLRR